MVYPEKSSVSYRKIKQEISYTSMSSVLGDCMHMPPRDLETSGRLVGMQVNIDVTVQYQNSRQCKASFIAMMIMPIMRAKLDITVREIVEKVSVEFHLKITCNKAWNARRISISKLYGDWDDSYRHLLRFLATLKLVMPTTVYTLSAGQLPKQERVFKCVFWSFGPSIEGWKHCCWFSVLTKHSCMGNIKASY